MMWKGGRMLEDTVAPLWDDGGPSSAVPTGPPPTAEPVLRALDLLRQQQVLRNRLVAADAIALTIAWTAVLATGTPGRRLAIATAAVATTLGTLSLQRFYRSGAVRATVHDVRSAIPAVAAGTAAAFLAAALLDVTPRPAALLVVCAGAALVTLTLGRSGYSTWLRANRATGRYSRPVVLIGGNEEAAVIEELLRIHPELGFRVLGVVASPDDFVSSLRERAPWLGDIDEAVQVVARTGVTNVVIAGTAVPYRNLQRLARQLPAAGVEVQLSTGIWGVAHRRLQWRPLAHEPVLTLEPSRAARWHAATKRGLDVVVATTCLVLASPLLALAALAVKLQDGGPILFAHDRVGQHGRRFRVFKLRTMVPDAERRLAELGLRNQRQGGPLFKVDDDPRVTKVGRFLRQASIDELPQLVNVLRGEMSLVGPRPALPREAAQFDEELRSQRLSVRPGITGLWQIEARDNPAFGAYRRLDLFYVENWSLGLDLMILWATVGRVAGRSMRALRRSGARARRSSTHGRSQDGRRVEEAMETGTA
jgi:exopolysaccharide biosynthesis polyprenyl glycosylphosphotransferase